MVEFALTYCNIMSYRGIRVTSSLGKIRNEAEYEDIEQQCGLQGGRSRVDNTCVKQRVIEKRTDRILAMHLQFVDFEKAHDTLPLKNMFKILKMNGLNDIYMRAFIKTYE